jgi:hypothetical protein
MNATRLLGGDLQCPLVPRLPLHISFTRSPEASTSLVDLAETLSIFSSSLLSHLVWFERVPEASLNALPLPCRSEPAISSSTYFSPIY